MQKKLLIGLAPLLATAVVAVSPALAQAEEPNWTIGGVELGVGATAPVESSGTTSFVLETAGGAKVTCTTLADHGTLTGGHPGTGTSTLEFSGCSSLLCPVEVTVAPVEVGITLGIGANEVVEAKVVLAKGAVLSCGGAPIGEVTGETTGTVEGNELVFEKSGGLKFNGEEATITGRDGQYSEGSPVEAS